MNPAWWNARIDAAGLASLRLSVHELNVAPGKRVHWWESRPADADGTTFVFLPGNGCSSLDVGPLALALAQHVRVVGIDPPGREPTLWPDEPFDFVDDLPPLIERLLDAARVGPCILVGHSMGAMLAFHVARFRNRNHPQTVRGLITMEGFVSMEVHARVVSPKGFRAVRFAPTLRAGWEERMAGDKAWLDARPTFAASFWESQKSRHDARAWVASLDLPILLVVGDLGQPMPPAKDLAAWRHHAGLDDLHDLDLCLVPRAGHWPMLDDPPAVIAATERWLARFTPSRR